MAKRIVSLDFGTRSIKLLELDAREMTVETFDEERLPLDGPSYLPDKDGRFRSDSDDGEAETDDAPPPDGDAGDPAPDAGADAPPADAPDPAWVETLETLLERNPLDPDTVVVTFLPDGRGISVHQEVPFAEDSKVASILPNLLEDRLPLKPSEIVYDFKVLTDEEADEHTAVVGIGRKRDIRFLLEHLQEAGADPSFLGLPELMHRYTLEATTSSTSGPQALVDIGHRFTRVLVLEDGIPVVARSVQFGGWDITKAIADEFDVTLEQAENYKERAAIIASGQAPDQQSAAVSELIQRELRGLVRDLRRNFQSLYATSQVRIETLHLCGGTSRIDNIEAFLADQFGVDVRPLPLSSAVEYGVIPDEVRPKTGLAVGLALQPARDRSADRMLDLRQDEFAHGGRSSFMRGQMAKLGAVAAALLILFVGTLFAKQYELESREAALKSAVKKQSRELLGKPFDDPDLIEKAVSGSSGPKRPYIPRMSAYQLLQELMANTSEDIKLEMDRIGVDIDRQIIQLRGITTDATTFERLQDDFEKLECLGEFTSQPLKKQGPEEAKFRLELQSNCT